MIARQRELDGQANQAALIATLPADQRQILEEAGGLEGLMKAYDASKIALAFGEGDIPRDDTMTEREADDRDARDNASRNLQIGIARTEAKTLIRLGKKVAVPGGEYDTIAEIATAFVTTKSWTIQNTESMTY